jgi:hypothetical protein
VLQRKRRTVLDELTLSDKRTVPFAFGCWFENFTYPREEGMEKELKNNLTGSEKQNIEKKINQNWNYYWTRAIKNTEDALRPVEANVYKIGVAPLAMPSDSGAQ